MPVDIKESDLNFIEKEFKIGKINVVPLLLNVGANHHWVGVIINDTFDELTIKYIDSENNDPVSNLDEMLIEKMD